MAKRKQSKKKADETLIDIVEARDQAQGFIEENQALIFGGLFAVVLLIGGIFAYNNFYRAPQAEKAMNEIFQAQAQFEKDSFALALTNPGGGFMGFLDIIDNYGGTPSGNLAKYYAGVSYLNLGQFDAAIDYLEDYSPDGEVTPIMKWGALGDANAEKGDLDKAMSLYQKAAKAGDNELLVPYYLKKIGLLHEKNGNFADALSIYEQIKSEYPTSPDGSGIEKYITRVSAKI